MRFEQIPSPFAAHGGLLWGAVVGERYTFCITFTTGIGYTATWKDGQRTDPHQANVIIDGAPSFAVAERACREQEERLRPH